MLDRFEKEIQERERLEREKQEHQLNQINKYYIKEGSHRQHTNNRKQKRKKGRKNSHVSNLPTIISFSVLIICLLVSCTVCIALLAQNRKVQKESIAVMGMIDTIQADMNSNNSVIYTEEEVQELLLQENSKVEKNFLDLLKTRMESGSGTVSMLREFFPEYIVMLDANEYLFFPKLETIKRHNYLDENFILQDNNEMIYQENEDIISKKGIDVSKYQGDIDWKLVSEDDIEYTFVRLGLRGYVSGEIVIDDTFEQNVKGASNENIGVGIYFVTQAISIEEAIEEADFVIEKLEPYKNKITYPVAIDIEAVASSSARAKNLSKEERTDYCIAFLERYDCKVVRPNKAAIIIVCLCVFQVSSCTPAR